MHSYDAAVLRTAGRPAVGASAAVCAVCAAVAGVHGLAGAGFAMVVTTSVFSLTLWLCSRTRTFRPTVVMGVALTGYVVLAAVLVGLLLATTRLTVLEPRAVAAGLVVGALAWVVAEVCAIARLRAPAVEPEGWPPAGDAPQTPTRAPA